MRNAPLTVATYRRVVRKHVSPTLGRMPLQKLTTSDLNALYAKLSAGGLSPSTVRLVHNVVHKALEAAVRQQLAIRNVAGYGDRPRIPRVQRRTWTASELREFLGSNADERLYAAWVFAATTGARRGEVLGLRWFDLDLEKGRAAIVQTVIPTGGKRWTFSTTKTGAGRQVALDSTTVEALKAHREQQLAEREQWGEAYQEFDLVFTRENGEPLDPNGFTDLFGTALKRAKLPKIRLHDLRHTHATLCLSAGVHPKVVSERLGHSSVKMTWIATRTRSPRSRRARLNSSPRSSSTTDLSTKRLNRCNHHELPPMNVQGTNWIRFIAVVGGTVVFAYFYGRWMRDTWNAIENPPTPPKPDPDDVKIATALAGALGGLFAVAMGIKSNTSPGTRVQRAGKGITRAGVTLTGTSARLLALPATLAVWTYFLAGLAAAITWEFNKSVTPPSVKRLPKSSAATSSP